MEPSTIAYYAALIFAVIIAISVHECAHAWTAMKFGDLTAYQEGRVTLNPIAHLDPMGTLLFILAGFGWGKPTPVNQSNLNHPRADLFVSAAGPISNLIVASLAALIIRTPGLMDALHSMGLANGMFYIVTMMVHLNLVLAFFNLLPVWPLDGSHVVENLLPPNKAIAFRNFGTAYGAYVLLGLIILGRLTPVSPIGLLIGPPVSFLSALLLGM
jgi:Zn-dependent protease